METEKIIYLEITSFVGISFNAEHYYGKLVGYLNNEYTTIDIEKKMTGKEAKIFSKKDDFKYMAGNITSRFDTQDEIINIARKTYKELFPNAKALILGRASIAEPQYVIDAPFDEKVGANNIYLLAERIGYNENGYCNNEDEMNKLSERFGIIIKSL